MSTNMQIWEKVSTTDTRYTKAAEVGGQKITSLNGTAMIMKATEVFGPVGIGFGWTVMEERFDEGSEMASGEGDKRLVLGRELNHQDRVLSRQARNRRQAQGNPGTQRSRTKTDGRR